jgi:hypothetical protein
LSGRHATSGDICRSCRATASGIHAEAVIGSCRGLLAVRPRPVAPYTGSASGKARWLGLDPETPQTSLVRNIWEGTRRRGAACYCGASLSMRYSGRQPGRLPTDAARVLGLGRALGHPACGASRQSPFRGARRGYAVGSAVLEAILPPHDGPTATAPVAHWGHSSRRVKPSPPASLLRAATMSDIISASSRPARTRLRMSRSCGWCTAHTARPRVAGRSPVTPGVLQVGGSGTGAVTPIRL